MMDRLYHRAGRHFRERRHALFQREMNPGPGHLLLDIGGTAQFWASIPIAQWSLVVLNISCTPTPQERGTSPYVTGDGCALPFGDRSFDFAFSNSAIEHVGDFARQVRFAEEVRRVGTSLWVQTPAKACPIEPHYLGLFIHWLPRALQRKVIRWATPWGWIARPSVQDIDFMVDSTRILTRAEMTRLFPDCRILTERMWKIIPKSYIATRSPLPSSDMVSDGVSK